MNEPSNLPKLPFGPQSSYIGVRPCANSTGLFHEKITLYKNPVTGEITRLLNEPISGNLPHNHGDIWEIGQTGAGKRDPNPYVSNDLPKILRDQLKP
jgi:hypothetical protein